MATYPRRLVAIAGLLGGLLSIAATPSPTPSASPSPTLGAATIPAATSTNLDWPLYGGDAANSRYSPATSITAANARTLRLAWSFHTGVFSATTSFEATPVVAGGRLFITAPDDEVFALDPTTGKLLWHATPQLEPDASPARLNRGVAYGDGRVYLATVDARLLAFDAATGKQLWAAQVSRSQGQFFESMAPQFDRGRVIVGLAAGEHEMRGFVAAYDAATGKQIWRFNTVPDPHDPGGDTWPATDRYLRGGGPVWMTPAVDPDLNLVILCVTNPSPDFNGSNRAGMNLYANSIVALHADTGTLAWYFQEVHHDLWDYDPASPPVLLSLPIGKQSIPAVIQAGKTGYLYVLDRRTGKPLFPTPEVPVPAGQPWQHAWPTQPEPQNQPFAPQCPAPGQFTRESCIFTPPDEQPTLSAPGALGGSAWSPVSYSPQTGFAYIEADTFPVLRSTTPRSCCFGRTPVPLPHERPIGALVGYDVAGGRIAWQAPIAGSLAYGGSAVTAGGVVFSGEATGYFDAHDAATGALLFQYSTGAGADAGPMVYAVGGKEYVAIAAGGNLILHSQRGDTLDVFTLR